MSIQAVYLYCVSVFALCTSIHICVWLFLLIICQLVNNDMNQAKCNFVELVSWISRNDFRLCVYKIYCIPVLTCINAFVRIKYKVVIELWQWWRIGIYSTNTNVHMNEWKKKCCCFFFASKKKKKQTKWEIREEVRCIYDCVCVFLFMYCVRVYLKRVDWMSVF